VLLGGAAGRGKSVVAAQLVIRARREGWPVLVLSADRRPSADTTGQMGERLGLPDSPVTVLAALAAGSPALLIVDQLDAVSVVSGRHPERLGVITDLLTEAGSYPGVRVILACRQFDLDNDREPRAVAGTPGTESVAIGDLNEEQVRDALTAAGLPSRCGR